MKKISIIFLTSLLSFVSVASNPPTKEVQSAEPIHLTKTEFLEKVFNYNANPKEWKYEGDKPAIIDFYATWCGPCKKVAPILDKLADEYAGELYVYKIDVDKEPELASMFGVRSIPTFLFVPMKGVPQISQGALPEKAFRKAISEYLLVKAKTERN